VEPGAKRGGGPGGARAFFLIDPQINPSTHSTHSTLLRAGSCARDDPRFAVVQELTLGAG